MRIGIVGYGNLGKGVEEYCLKNSQIELVGIYSRRHVKTSSSETLPFEMVYTPLDVDVLILCGGTKTLNEEAKLIAKYNNIIDAYDNHNNIENHINDVKTSLSNDRIAILACGWDPGLLSIFRCLSKCLIDSRTITIWGKGVSQGHTQSIKDIDGVIDGIQVTVPINKNIKGLSKTEVIPNSTELHKRLCYVYCKKENRKKIRNEIKEIPDYFVGYKTSVKFVNKKRLEKLKKFHHKGRVIGSNRYAELDLRLSTISNPMLTAGILIKLAFVLKKMQEDGEKGVFTMLDIPPKYYSEEDDKYTLL